MAANWNLFGSFWADIIYWAMLIGWHSSSLGNTAPSEFTVSFLSFPFATLVVLAILDPRLPLIPSFLADSEVSWWMRSLLWLETFTLKQIHFSFFLLHNAFLHLLGKVFFSDPFKFYLLSLTPDIAAVKKRLLLSKDKVTTYKQVVCCNRQSRSTYGCKRNLGKSKLAKPNSSCWCFRVSTGLFLPSGSKFQRGPFSYRYCNIF